MCKYKEHTFQNSSKFHLVHNSDIKLYFQGAILEIFRQRRKWLQNKGHPIQRSRNVPKSAVIQL